MIIKCWGSRGSIPVSGKEFNRFGGDSTCVEIRTKNNEIIIVDSGSGVRRLGNHILTEENKVLNFVFTHSHWDHMLGFPFFKPLYHKEYKINIFGCPFAQDAIHKMFSPSMIPPFLPIEYEDLRAEMQFNDLLPAPFEIDSVTVVPIALSHPNYAKGYKFIEDGKSFVFFTDNEIQYKHPGSLDYGEYVQFVKHSDLLFHDAEYTAKEYEHTKSWGHSTYEDAVQFALDADVKMLGLFHHNQDRTDEQIVDFVADCNEILDNSGSDIKCFAVGCDTVIEL
ncbi:MAG: MBL fold metallo-hydrolase [Rhodothermaceae bacterium]